MTRASTRACLALAAVATALLTGADPAGRPNAPQDTRAPAPARTAVGTAPKPAANPTPVALPTGPEVMQGLAKSASVGIFALATLAPAAVLMLTSFVRISIVLTLLRQALGSPQVPGNQVLMALSLLLTALVMAPEAEQVYRKGVEPFANGRLDALKAWDAGVGPIKTFMLKQIKRAGHQRYLGELYNYVEPDRPGRVVPKYEDELSIRVVAPAFLLSELTTALMIGFAIYLPFLVVDLVVSAVLAAMGLFMLPPSLVAMPLKLILFVLADGWLLVATMLLRSFG